ncbi:MAG: GNAT family N-acetyltransferase [Chitinophagaceae bacterium]|nr:GNAT family N-acetyltransferase [Chitinophagaceae bacterium]
MNVFETDRLALSHLSADDATFIFELLNTPGWLQFIGDRGIKTLHDAAQYILNGPVKSYKSNGFGLLAVRLKDSLEAIGICGLIKRAGLDDIDIGFAFLPAYNGKGYAAEAAHATLDYGFENVGLNRIVAITNEDNINSIRLLKKIGMQYERKILLDGDSEELLLFGIARGSIQSENHLS